MTAAKVTDAMSAAAANGNPGQAANPTHKEDWTAVPSCKDRKKLKTASPAPARSSDQPTSHRGGPSKQSSTYTFKVKIF